MRTGLITSLTAPQICLTMPMSVGVDWRSAHPTRECRGQPYSPFPGQFGLNNIVYEPDPTLFIISKNGEIHPADVGKVVNGVSIQDRRYTQTGFVFDKTFKTPMVQNFSLEIQYELMANTAVTIGYQGSRGTHLFNTPRDINVNPFNSSRAIPGFTTNSGRIILFDETNSSSTYHAGKIDVERRFTKGLQFRFNYTFSKFIDDSSGGIEFDFGNLAGQDRSAQQIRINSPQNSFGTTSERAVSPYDTPHVFNLTAIAPLVKGGENDSYLFSHDHDVMRSGLRAMFEAHKGWEVCGEARDGHEAVRLALEVKPDIAVIDLTMPGLDGVELVLYAVRNSIVQP